jgi:hypothetical protein
MSEERQDLTMALRLLLPYRADSDGIDEAILYIEDCIQNLIEQEQEVETPLSKE